MVNTEASEGISFNDMVHHQRQVADIVRADPDGASVADNVGLVGNNAAGGSNTGRMFIELKTTRSAHAHCRRRHCLAAAEAGRGPGHPRRPGEPVADQSGGGGRPIYQFTLQDADTEELYRWAPVLEERVREIPGLLDVNSDLKRAARRFGRISDPQELEVLARECEAPARRALTDAIMVEPRCCVTPSSAIRPGL